MSTDIRLVYVTAPDRDVALTLARMAVQDRLAACANVMGGISSVYWWDGRLTEDDEVALVLKTRSDLAEALVARLRAAHPYDCPCVVVLPVDGGNPDFLAWIAAETAV